MSDIRNTTLPQKNAAPHSDSQPPTAKPKAKPKRGTFFLFLIVLSLFGGGYYAYLNDWLSWEELPFSWYKPQKPANLLTEMPARLNALEQSSNDTAINVTDAQNALTELRDEVLLLKRQQIVLQSRLAELDNTQNAAFPLDIRLQLIDIQLRQSGDAAAAAAALLRLQEVEGVDIHWLSGEVKRLQEMPSKEKIITIINQLAVKIGAHYQQEEATDVALAENGLLADTQTFFKKLFHVRHIKNDNQTATFLIDEVTLQQQLARLELLFISDQRAAYQRALEAFIANWQPTANADRNIAIQLQLLQKYGAPMYYLNH